MNSELYRKSSLPNLRYYPGICLQGLKNPNEKYQRNLRVEIRARDQPNARHVRFIHRDGMITSMRRITTFRSTTDHIYDSGLMRL